MLGRVGRGQLTEVKFLKRTLRWHEQEMCVSWSGGTRYVTELVVLLGLKDTRAMPWSRWTPFRQQPSAQRSREPTKLDRLDANDAPGQVPGGAQRTQGSSKRPASDLGWDRLRRRLWGRYRLGHWPVVLVRTETAQCTVKPTT